MSTLLTVYTWAGQDAIVQRNWDTWQHKGVHIVSVSPVDAPSCVVGPVHGKSQKFGAELMQRILYGMQFALDSNYDNYVFTEGDSVILKPVPDAPPALDAFCCYAYENTEPEKFKGKRYTHFAWWMTRDVLERVVKAMQLYNLAMEQGLADRVMGCILGQERIPIVHCPEQIYSANEMLEEDRWNEIEKYRESLIFVHGIKTEKQFRRAMTYSPCGD